MAGEIQVFSLVKSGEANLGSFGFCLFSLKTAAPKATQLLHPCYPLLFCFILQVISSKLSCKLDLFWQINMAK